jgi:hypothetical protein
MREHPTTPQSGTIDRSTLIPLGVTATIIGSLIGATWWLQGRLSDIDRRLERIEYKTDSSWNQTSMENWALKLARNNPTITVPDVK